MAEIFSTNGIYKTALKDRFPSEYNSFRGAQYRCTRPNATDWKYYGGRGIEFRFENFSHFLSVVGAKPSPEHTLDRIDVNGHYEAGNVKWATRKEQMNNTRKNVTITAFGKTQTVAEWSDETGIRRRNIQFRLRVGWCLDCVFSNNVETCVHGYDKIGNLKKSLRRKNNNRVFTINGETKTLVEWSEISGLKQTTISMRFHQRGWCENCLILPIGGHCTHINKEIALA